MRSIYTTLAIGILAIAVGAQGYSDNEPAPAVKYDHVPGPGRSGITYKITPCVDSDLASTANDLTKSEFETKAQYSTRIRQLIEKTAPKCAIIFNVDIASYDAETRQMLVTPKVWRVGSSLRPEHQQTTFVRWQSYWHPVDQLETLQVEMAPEVARMLKPQISFAVFGIPVARDPGTVNINFAPLKIAVFNRETFEIYAVRDLNYLPHE